jgi:tRNA(fMet)-specific endonuclease VapC
MRYLLDANVVIAFLNDSSSAAAQRAKRERVGDLGIPAVVAHELFHGAFKSRREGQNLARLDALLFPIVEFDGEDARHAGLIRARLGSQGIPLGPYDVLIAGQAMARGLTLVTHNTREFNRVPGLRIQDWEA